MGQTCHRCGGQTKYVERTADETPTDHHNHVYYCDTCDLRIVSG